MKTPKPEPNRPIFAPIQMGKMPTMPIPWLSADSGETWIWSDFFMIFQKNPPSFFDLLHRKEGQHGGSTRIKYPFILSVFYHLKKNPNGPSRTPILVVAVESSNCLDLPIISVFKNDERSNVGFVEEKLTRQTALLHLLATAGEWLKLPGKPRRIGSIHEAAGHPETGLPPACSDFSAH